MKRTLGFALLTVAALTLALTLLGTAAGRAATPTPPPAAAKAPALTVYTDKVVKTAEEWKQVLTPEQFRILRQAGTEIAGTGALVHNHAKGVYRCAACGQLLFSSETKFESGTGWPSFYQPFSPKSVASKHDGAFGWDRTEVLCSRCGGHLGHVFNDGPQPTGLRYCMNSAALKFDATP